MWIFLEIEGFGTDLPKVTSLSCDHLWSSSVSNLKKFITEYSFLNSNDFPGDPLWFSTNSIVY